MPIPKSKWWIGGGVFAAAAVVVLAVAMPRWTGRERPVRDAILEDRYVPRESMVGAPEVVLQTGHTGPVGSLAWSPDGRLLASSSQDGTVRLWEITTRRELRWFGMGGSTTGLLTRTPDVAFTPDGAWIHAWLPNLQHDHSGFWAWAVATGDAAATRPFAERPSADHRLVAAVDRAGVYAGDLVNQRGSPLIARRHREMQHVLFSPGNRWLLIGEEDSVKPSIDFEAFKQAQQADAIDAIVHVWDTANWQNVCTIDTPRPLLYVPVFSPDERWVALMTPGRKTVELWDVANGCQRFTLKTETAVSRLAFSPDSRLLAGGSGPSDGPGGDGSLPARVVLWDVIAGGAPRLLRTAEIEDLAFSADGQRLAIAGRDGVSYWRAEDGWRTETRVDESPASAIAFSPDSMRLAWAWQYGAEIRVRDLKSAEERRIDARGLHIASVAISGDGRWIGTVTPGRDTTLVQVWDLRDGRATPFPINDAAELIAFSPDSQTMLVAGRRLTSFDMRTFEEAPASDGLGPVPAFSSNGQWLASGGDDSVRVQHAISKHVLRQFKTSAPVMALAVTPRGERVAAATGTGASAILGLPAEPDTPAATVTLWDTATGAEIRTWKTAAAQLALSGDGQWIAFAGGHDQPAFQLWKVDSQDPPLNLGQAKFGMMGAVTAIAFSPDSTRVAFANGQHQVEIWATASRKQIASLPGHTARVAGLVFSADGRSLVSAGDDGTVRLWTVEQPQLAATLVSRLTDRGQSEWLVVTPDGLFDGAPGSWRRLLWRFGGNTFDVAPAEALFAEFFSPGLLADVMEGKRPVAPRNVAALDRRQPRVTLSVRGAPPGDAPVESRFVRIELDVTEAPADDRQTKGSGIRDLRLFRNGSLVASWPGEQKAHRAAVHFDVPLLAGNNDFTAYAFNRDNVKSEDATLTVRGADSLAQPGTLYIVAIGVDEYANPTFNLKYAVADAQQLARQLAVEQQALGRFERVEVVPLHNAQATKEHIIDVLERLGGRRDPIEAFPGLMPADPEDVVILFFAGHGINDGARFYLVPHDLGVTSDRGNLDGAAIKMLASRSISDRELEEKLTPVLAQQILLVIDACHSGQALESSEKRRGPLNVRGLAQLAWEKGMYVLTAAQAYQSALENAKLGHGLLTYALVEDGLSQGAADHAPQDGRILVREWLDFAAERVPQLHVEQSDGARALRASDEISIAQRPRMFYRRELDAEPFVISTGVSRRRTN